MRTRDDAWGAYSGVGAGGDAVALMELLPGVSTVREGAPLCSYWYGNEVRVLRYTEALGALGQVVANAEDYLSEVALHSSRTGAATTLAAEGEVAQTVIRRTCTWKSSRVFQGTYPEDPGMVSRKLANTGKIESSWSGYRMGPNSVI